MLAGTWTVWLPPGYEAVEEDRRWQGPHRPEITISRRLFGPLGRDPGQKAFNPFVAQDWLTLADEQGEFHPAESNSFRGQSSPGGMPLDGYPRLERAELGNIGRPSGADKIRASPLVAIMGRE